MIHNKTPHAIRVYRSLGHGNYEMIAKLEPTEESTRLHVRRRVIGDIGVNGHPVPVHKWDVNASEFAVDGGLPPERDGEWYIVSRMVADYLTGRSDLLVVDEIVRDNATGKIVGCQSFSVIHNEDVRWGD